MKKVLLILMCLLFTAPAYAIIGISVGAKGGVASSVDLTAISNISGLELDKMNIAGLQFKFGALPKIDLIFTADYYWKTKKFELSGGEAAEFSVSNLALTASAVYTIKMRIISPYVGAGIASHSLAFSVKGPWKIGSVPVDATEFGYHLIGGVNFSLPLIPLSFTGEARYNWIKTEHEKSDFISLTLGANMGVL